MRDELPLFPECCNNHFIPADRHASLSACIGYNVAPLRPHCANKTCMTLDRLRLTNIVEGALRNHYSNFVNSGLFGSLDAFLYANIYLGRGDIMVYFLLKLRLCRILI